MTDKLFSHVGIATYKARTKLRWTNGNVDARLKILAKNGFTDVEFVELPNSMTKSEALLTDTVRALALKHNLQLGTENADELETPAPTLEAA
jgi:hypothetical protein